MWPSMSPTRQVRLAQARGLILSLSSRRQNFPRVQPLHFTSMQMMHVIAAKGPFLISHHLSGHDKSRNKIAGVLKTSNERTYGGLERPSHAQAREANFIHRRSAEDDSTTYTCCSTHHAGHTSKTMLSRQRDAFSFSGSVYNNVYSTSYGTREQKN